MSVVSLPGMAGGDLANVNRWRDQMKLAPIDEDTLRKSAEHIRRTVTTTCWSISSSEAAIDERRGSSGSSRAILDENGRRGSSR